MVELAELQIRWERLRGLMRKFLPDAGGLLIFSRLNIYYFTGSFGNGILWLPLEGSPVFLSRRGIKRADIESPLEAIYPMRSYSEIKALLSSAGSALTDKFAVEKNGLSWALSESFIRNLKGHEFLGGDNVIGICRGTKTPWELRKIREAGARHNHAMVDLLPPLIKRGMTEFEIAHTLSNLLYTQGHHGIIRMEKFGEEAFMGHISAGDSGNYPSVFNGPLGLRGTHPATPYMGSADKRWEAHEPLSIDCGFNLDGYQTDKTQMYWAGSPEAIPARMREAFDFSVGVQGWLKEHLKPGAVPSELWAHCEAWAADAGWAEGFMGLEANKVSFVGHGIGLAVDEYPVLARGFDMPLEAGMVIAVEPKLGLQDIGMIGVENTFEVTPDGGVSLTGAHDGIVIVQPTS